MPEIHKMARTNANEEPYQEIDFYYHSSEAVVHPLIQLLQSQRTISLRDFAAQAIDAVGKPIIGIVKNSSGPDEVNVSEILASIARIRLVTGYYAENLPTIAAKHGQVSALEFMLDNAEQCGFSASMGDFIDAGSKALRLGQQAVVDLLNEHPKVVAAFNKEMHFGSEASDKLIPLRDVSGGDAPTVTLPPLSS